MMSYKSNPRGTCRTECCNELVITVMLFVVILIRVGIIQNSNTNKRKMNHIRSSRWLYVFLFTGFLANMAMPLILMRASVVEAAACGWATVSTISCDGGTFTQATTNGNSMTLNGPQISNVVGTGMCPADNIVVNPYQTATKAKYTTYTSTASGKYNASCNPTTTNITLSNTYAKIKAATPAPTTTTTTTAQPVDPCPISSWALRWLVCPVIDVIDHSIVELNPILDGMFTISPTITNANEKPGISFYKAWGDFRDIAVSLLVIVALVMVIGQAMGVEMLDAYSIRKVLPRLLIAAIALTLSWPLMGFVVQFFNDMGNWIGDIILYPFAVTATQLAGVSPGGATGIATDIMAAGVAGAGIAGAIFVLGVPGIIALMLSLLLALIVAFITLLIREMIIIICMITAPIAIVSYILPATQKLWKFWKDAFISALIMFPIVSAFIATGRVLAIISSSLPGAAPIMAPIAIVVSYFMISTAFKLAGGLMGQASGMVQGFHGGAFNKLKSFRNQQPAKRLDAARKGELYKGSNALTRKLNPIAQNIGYANKLGFRPKNMRANMEAATGRAELNQSSGIMQDDQHKATLQDDNKDWAILDTTGKHVSEGGTRKYEDNLDGVKSALLDRGRFWEDDGNGNKVERNAYSDPEELNAAAAEVMNFKKTTGNGTATLMAAGRAMASTGTGFKDTVGENGEVIAHDATAKMLDTINRVTGSDRASATTMLAEMRGAAVQSGRVDLGGAGFGDSLGQMAKLQKAQKTAAGGVIDTETMESVNATMLQKVVESNSGSQLINGKPYAAAAAGRAHATKLAGLISTANQSHDEVARLEQQLEMGPVEEGHEQKLSAARLKHETAVRDVDAQAASVKALYEVMGHASPQNQRELGNALSQQGLTNLRGVGISEEASLAGGGGKNGMDVLQFTAARQNGVSRIVNVTVQGPNGPVVQQQREVLAAPSENYKHFKHEYGSAYAAESGQPPPEEGG
jgi:hypothetical protein